jgi:hypothetical protein
MSKLTAELQGPGGASIRSSRQSKSEEMHITFRIDRPELDLTGNNPITLRRELGRRIRDLQEADAWLSHVLRDLDGLKRALAKSECEHGSIDARIGDSIRKLYDDRILREIDSSILRSAPSSPPVAFDKKKLMEVVAEARAVARKAGMDPINRWMLAVESIDEVWKMFPHSKPNDDSEYRAPTITPTGGSYGLLQGLKVMIDPSIEGWELRDSETGEKIQFIENLDEPVIRYYFDGSKLGAIQTWPREV